MKKLSMLLDSIKVESESSNYDIREIYLNNSPSEWGVYALSKPPGRTPYVKYGTKLTSKHSSKADAIKAIEKLEQGKVESDESDKASTSPLISKLTPNPFNEPDLRRVIAVINSSDASISNYDAAKLIAYIVDSSDAVKDNILVQATSNLVKGIIRAGAKK